MLEYINYNLGGTIFMFKFSKRKMRLIQSPLGKQAIIRENEEMKKY